MPQAVRRVYELVNPRITDLRTLEYGGYLRWLRIRGVERPRRPWETVHCDQTVAMYFAYLRSVSIARDTRRLDRAIVLRVRRLARIRLRHELGTQYRMPNGARVGTHTTVYSPKSTREGMTRIIRWDT